MELVSVYRVFANQGGVSSPMPWASACSDKRGRIVEQAAIRSRGTQWLNMMEDDPARTGIAAKGSAIWPWQPQPASIFTDAGSLVRMPNLANVSVVGSTIGASGRN